MLDSRDTSQPDGTRVDSAAGSTPAGQTRTAGAGRVLLVANDPELDSFADALRGLRLDVVCARNGRQALDAARRRWFSLLLVDLNLPDMPGWELVRTFRAERLGTSFIVTSGRSGRGPAAVNGIPLAALGSLRVSADPRELRSSFLRGMTPVLDEGAGYSADIEPPAPEPRVLLSPMNYRTMRERWAAFIMHVVESAYDLKTIDAWAQSVGASRSVICECCRLVHVVPHDARDFARMLRAVRSGGREWQPEAALDCADSRTLNKLIARAGLASWREARKPTTEEFLRLQHWIPEYNPGLLVLRTLLF
jgi:CheY-like chemotaxis protein